MKYSMDEKEMKKTIIIVIYQLVVMLVVYSFFVCLDQSVKDFVRVEIFQILK